MEHQMPLVLMLLLLLLAARIGGEIMERLGQLAMIGEIAAGIVLGPSLLGIIQPNEELKILSDLGVFLLVMLAGMEMDFNDIKQSFRGRGMLIAICGFFIPFAVGNGLAHLLGYEPTMMVFLGLCMAITALPVSVRILMDLGRLETNIGRRIVTVAVQDDTTALLLLGMILGVKARGGLLVPLLITGLKTAVFFGTVVLVAALVRYSKGHIPHSRKFVAWAEKNFRGKEPLFALTLVFVFAFGTFTEAIGLHFVVGAFFGSMILSRKILGKENYEDVEKMASGVTMGFLAPVFFAAIGVEFQISALTSTTVVVSVLTVAFLTKVLGGYIGGRLAGLNSPDSWVMGFGMNGRGVMELVIADLALKKGFISADLFSTLVFMGMVTTVITPVMLKWAFERAEAHAAAEKLAAPALAAEGAPRPATHDVPVPEELISDLSRRRDWARNASGTESDAGAGRRLTWLARGVDRRHRPVRRLVEQLAQHSSQVEVPAAAVQPSSQRAVPAAARPFSAGQPARGWMGIAFMLGAASVGLRLLLSSRRVAT
jgi:Kef-type K+ transport system membrane component KefB